ncbi:hypothetical protein RhiirA4_472508 [Rhizophagus irregularis]|uniref:Uncharacterized protein n=1 Tax=Rhizophagus irregularis TaxID=588596 RepID=A0A2I1H549_9GLOM|nr:hypothetical protein RhiirA4_472508 [Rhizophagus irregularis]
MAKLHTYYITNAKSELKFAYNTLFKDQFQNEVWETFSNPSFFDDDDVESDYDDDEDNDQNENENDDANNGTVNNTNLEISRWINIIDKELQELLQTEVNVVIDISSPPPVNYDSQEFNMEEVLDKVLT